MRSFLSYDIDDPDFRQKISSLQIDLKKSGADLKLVEPDILHFTIRFLREIDEEDKQVIIRNLKGKVEEFEQDVRFKGVGTFPDERRISVIWIGIDPDSAKMIAEHAKKVNGILDTVPGLPKEGSQEFSPHVTIARVRTGRNKDKLIQAILEHKNQDFGSTRIRRLRLKLSVLTPSGPQYLICTFLRFSLSTMPSSKSNETYQETQFPCQKQPPNLSLCLMTRPNWSPRPLTRKGSSRRCLRLFAP